MNCYYVAEVQLGCDFRLAEKTACKQSARSVWSARSLLPLSTGIQSADCFRAFSGPQTSDSGSKLLALQTLRDLRLPFRCPKPGLCIVARSVSSESRRSN